MIPVAVKSSQHHVCGVQRVDEVWREGILLFYCVWPPVKEQKNQVHTFLKSFGLSVMVHIL